MLQLQSPKPKLEITFFEDDFPFYENESPSKNLDGFELPGSGESHYWCGIWQTYGCLSHKKAYVRQFKKTCFRSICPTCYQKWAIRQATRTTKKLVKVSTKSKSQLHNMIITLQTPWNVQSKKNLRETLKKMGVDAAVMIYTPFTPLNHHKFYLKNTVQVIYTGKLDTSALQHSFTIYEFDNIGISKSEIFSKVYQMFVDSGVKKGMHPVTWFGNLQYCKLILPTNKINHQNCPKCNRKLRLIYFKDGIDVIPPDKSFDGWLRKDGWKYCNKISLWSKIVRKVKHLIILGCKATQLQF